MKIAIIAPTRIPGRQANTIQVMKMAQAFVSRGYEIRLFAPARQNDSSNSIPNWADVAYHYGLVHEIHIEWIPARDWLRKYDFAWSAVRTAAGWEAAVVYTRLPQAAAISAALGLKTILEVHDMPHGFAGSRIFNGYLRARGAARLVVISKILANDLRDRYRFPDSPSFLQIIPDGVDLTRYSELSGAARSRTLLLPRLKTASNDAGSRFNPQRFTAGYTGHLYAGRGIELILDLARRIPDMNFLVVGGEPEDVDRVAAKINELALDNLTLTGFISNADLPKYQAACDVLLMPYQERVAASSGGDIARYLSPMKLFEYLACGRAICSSDLPVLREVLTDENAMLLPPDDISAWELALQRLHRDGDLCLELGKNARAAAVHYTWDRRAEKVLAGLTLVD